MKTTFLKDPDAVLDFSVDWSEWLPTGDTISTATFAVPTGLTKDSENNTSTVAAVWLSGGTVNTDYEVVCHIETAGGREQDQTLKILVRQQ